ncbi:esterase/lipase family protein [Sphingomonas fennica]|uniref:Alpha/beta hydrolase n=1 Tax=Edaphosphingomonas fennica TaxID=114404 RepID=A0A2T4I454_9SPHN|nr:alpha/beta hydrolase [Sphingomonas fennica]PTD24197.1 alpha/beta hydrolase [Sphingomonas fennica]
MPDPMSPPSDYPAVVDATIPPLGRFLAEGSALVTWPFTARTARRIAAARRGDGRAVMVIPGFLAGDPMTSRLRRMLRIAGYAPHGWGLGMNRGVTPDLLDRLAARLEAIAQAEGTPVSLVGWSLGGLYARELAKRRPDLVDRVITLGSPFSGDPRANRAWKLYERINGHLVDRPPIDVDLPAKPPMRTIALWSAEDGIVAPACARGLPHEADSAVRVACRHMDFVTAPAALAAILDALEA